MIARFGQLALCLAMGSALAGCAPKLPNSAAGDSASQVTPEVRAMYAAVEDGGFQIDAVQDRYLIAENIRREVDLTITDPPGTIVIDPWQRYLYLTMPGNRAMRYRVAVGDQGRSFSGVATAKYDRSWPSWTPTANMVKEFPDLYAQYKNGVPGGLKNPLGARAIYLFNGGKDTYYRIHGTNEVASIGHATSAGCIRLYNQDIIDLVGRYKKGGKVIVLTQEQSSQGFGSYLPTTSPYLGTAWADAGVQRDPNADTYPTAYPSGFPDSPATTGRNDL